MDELNDLYQEIILSHNKRPRNDGILDPYSHKAEGFNPLCGDKSSVFLHKPGENIEEITCQTEGCAISRASGSIMTTMTKGKTQQEVEEIIEGIKVLLSGEEEPEVDLATQGDLAALIGVRKFPARVKCATLAWHALESALKGGDTTTTE